MATRGQPPIGVQSQGGAVALVAALLAAFALAIGTVAGIMEAGVVAVVLSLGAAAAFGAIAIGASLWSFRLAARAIGYLRTMLR